MAGVPATISFAIRHILTQHPDAATDEVVRQLIARGWDFDLLEMAERVTEHMPQSASLPASSPTVFQTVRAPEPPVDRERSVSGLSLASLPESLRRTIQANPEAFEPAEALQVQKHRRTSPRWSEIKESIQEALDDELSIVRNRYDTTRMSVGAGQLLGRTRDGVTVRYDLERDAPLADGSQVQVDFQGQLLEAEVVALSGTAVTLWIRTDGAVPVPRATVVLDASFLLRLRRSFLQALEERGEFFDVASALSLLDNAVDGREDDDFHDPRLAVEQNQFVCRALSGGLSWLWGPPGTGKTTTLAHLLKELRKRGKRVLFVSNTNAAVDTALLRYLDVDEPQSVGTVLRLGEPALAEVRDNETAPVLTEQIVASQGEEIGRHLVECKRDLSKLRRRNNAVQDVIRDPLRARDRGLIGAPEDDLFDLHRLIDAQGLHVEARALPPRIGNLVDRKKALEKLTEMLTNSVVSRAQLVFGTVHRTYLRDLAAQRFDVVVLDEASMVSTDLALIAAGLSSGHLVVAGDFRQLGPIALTESPEGRRWLRASVFETAGISSALSDGPGRFPSNVVALRTQHRMRPAIEALVGDTFYREVGLRTGDSVRARARSQNRYFPEDLVVVDTSSLRPWMGKRNGRWSRYNVIHAQVVASLLPGVPESASVGVVAPFAPQAALLRAIVGQDDADRSAATVHRFQGGERDVLFWDMTEGRAGARKITGWFEAVNEREEGSRLINVALSRARDQLIVVADLDRARSACAHGTMVRKVVDRMERDGRKYDARDLLTAGSGVTELVRGAVPHDPLVDLLDNATSWVSIWSSSPPSKIHPRLIGAVSAARERGVQVYVRTGVPGSQAQHAAVAALQAFGCSVLHVRPCWENVAVSEKAVLSSPGGLLDLGPEQLTLTTRDGAFASAVARMLKRRSGPSEESGEMDAVCVHNHPKLLEHAQHEDFTYRCPACDFRNGRSVRTGRSRARSAATITAVICRSCDSAYGIDGRCGC